MRGYDKKEVDEFLDDVIKDYGVYIALVKELQEENAKLKAKTSSAPASRPAYASASMDFPHGRQATMRLSKNCTNQFYSTICFPKTSFSKRLIRFKIS